VLKGVFKVLSPLRHRKSLKKKKAIRNAAEKYTHFFTLSVGRN
jgi:hypothetical protein